MWDENFESGGFLWFCSLFVFNYLHTLTVADCESNQLTSTCFQLQYQVQTFHKALLITSTEGKAILLHTAGYKNLLMVRGTSWSIYWPTSTIKYFLCFSQLWNSNNSFKPLIWITWVNVKCSALYIITSSLKGQCCGQQRTLNLQQWNHC